VSILGQASDMGVALRERAKDMLRPPLSRASTVDRSAPRSIALTPFDSDIPFDPALFGRWHRRLKQDVMDEGADPPMLRTRFEYHALVLADARILSDGVTHVSVYDATDALQTEWSTHYRLRPLATLKRRPTRTVPGTTLNLCAPLATLRGNFAHWLLDALARWILLEDRADESIAIDTFLLPAGMPHFRESLRALGVSDERMLELPLHEALAFERLVCVSRPRGWSSNVAPGWLLEGYRRRMAPVMSPPDQADTRLYISRRDAGSRKFRDEEALVAALEERGYQTVELSKLGFAEKAALFSRATDVIGLAGAGMMSVMFCPRGTRVVELLPSSFVIYLYATICAALGHEHHAYVFRNNSRKAILSPFSGEFDLDLADFLRMLDARPANVPAARRS